MTKPLHCLITAGPTREYFDPVRYVTNPSSGKMGYALAKAALNHGWTVDLITGPVALLPPDGADVWRVTTAEDMLHAVQSRFAACQLLIMTAAVCDMRPRETFTRKVKKDALKMTVEMEPTPDILRTIAAQKTSYQRVVGFAAETDDMEINARKKLIEKHLDWIVANKVGGKDSAFESGQNSVYMLGKNNQHYRIGPAAKTTVAVEIIEILAKSEVTD